MQYGVLLPGFLVIGIDCCQNTHRVYSKAKEMNDEAMKKIALLEKKNQEYEAKMNLFKQCFNAFRED